MATYDEATDGDISDGRLSPDDLALTLGDNLITASQSSSDDDYITVTIPAGHRLAQIVVVAYSAADLAFIAVQAGATFTEDSASPDPANILGGDHYGPGHIGTDILDDMGSSGLGFIGFTPPLTGTTYTFWFNQTSAAASTVTFNFIIEAAGPTSGDDSLVGGAGGDTIAALAGDDTVLGAGGDDSLSGDAGNDQLFGAAGNDTLLPGLGDDLVAGGGDNDLIHGVSGADTLAGGVGSDTITGGDGADSIDGGDDADTLDGDGHDDTMDGGLGDDTMGGQGGRDVMSGDDGADTMHGFGSHDTLLGGTGNDDLRGGFGRDLLNGSADNDAVRGFEGEDRLFGGGGVDTLLGGDDADSLIGGGGGDRLKGDDGNDTLNGSFGADVVTGGLGDDLFEFRKTHGADTIDDFVAGAASEDVVRLIAFGAAFDSFAEVIAAASQVGADVVIDFGGGDVLTVQNVTLAALHADDFTFG